MSNFGFGRLRLVNPYHVAFQEARSAVHAHRILRDAEEFATLAEAIADCSLVVGTTSLGHRELQHTLRPLEYAGKVLRKRLASAPVALLFGSEKFGLSNEDMSYCHWLLRIGTEGSMNLGQAVAVCLYELVRQKGTPAEIATPAAAQASEVERITLLLTEVLEQTGYTKRHPANCDGAQIRRLVLRMGVTARDAPVWMGVLRQVLWKLRQSKDGEV